jgi:cysteine synthase A
MNVYQSITQIIGNTPLLELCNYEAKQGLPAKLLVKLESQNPAGSAKDRVAYAMIRAAEEEGLLTPGATIVEPTSGNTGIGLAAVAAARGYSVILTMPDTMSKERQTLLRAYGAKVVLTEGAKGMQGAIEKAEELAKALPQSFIPGQFDNPSNPAIHLSTTGPEIWRDTDGTVDIFVAGVGTGGTLTGVGQYLKQQNPKVTIVAVEPANSPLLSQGISGSHNLQGIGANFIPSILDREIYDEVIPVWEEDAYRAGRALAGDGLLCGISGGAAVWAATQLALRPENNGKCIVALLPDSGERYLSTELYHK